MATATDRGTTPATNIKPETLTFIEGTLATAQKLDPAITSKKVKLILQYLATGDETPTGDMVKVVTNSRPLDEIVDSPAAAKMLNCTTRTLRNLEKRGLIRKVSFGITGRAQGYALSSIQELIEKGKAA